MTKIAEQAVSDAIDYIVAHWQDQPDLDALAARAGYDVTHFQKTFTRMVGISPKRLVQFMNARHARDLLLTGYSTLDAAYASGLSGNGRLHDLLVSVEAATPGAAKVISNRVEAAGCETVALAVQRGETVGPGGKFVAPRQGRVGADRGQGLVLGGREPVGGAARDLFDVVDARHRIYARRATTDRPRALRTSVLSAVTTVSEAETPKFNRSL